MSLSASIAAFAAAATGEVFVNGRRMTSVVSIATDTGFDSVASSATVVLATDPGGIDHRQEMEVRLGWDGRTQTVWKGIVEATEPRFGADGFQLVITGAGQLSKALLRYWDEVTYTGVADEAIVDDLLTNAGVGARSIQGDGEVLGVVRDVIQAFGTSPWDLINEIDQVFGYKTWDGPDGVVRRRKISGTPSANPSKTYTQGVDIFSVGRPRTVRGISNAVQVTGLAQVSFTPVSTRLALNPLVPTPPTYVMFEFQSDLIETGALADEVSDRILIEVNRMLEQVMLETKGDPRRQPGETVKVVSTKLDLSSGANFWVRHVHHEFGPGGFTTTLTLEGGVGSSGPLANVPPEAIFTYLVTRETYLVSGTPTDMWTVTCDGSASFDPDGVDGSIATYAWANNKNSDTGSAVTYATAFTAAQMAAAPTITLTVTDALGATGALTQEITAPTNTTLVRDLYIAAGSRAEATSDGGKTWQTWTPGAGTVVSTPTIAGQTHSYFGLSDGKLYRTDNYLGTAPTLVHDFGSQVNCIWIHERNADRVTVGLANGQVHNTTNASALGSSTWNLLKTYGAAVLDVVESGAVAGQYRVSTGDSIRITYDEFVSDAALITWSGGTARQIIPSIVGLPGKGTATGTGPVKSEDGTTYTYATTAPTDVHAGTHHIRQAALLVVDRTGKVWTTADGGTVFTNVATLPASDPANRAIRDGDNQMVFYVAADDGAYKTFDGGVTWKLLRDYAGGSLFGRQIGYGAMHALAITPLTVFSLITATDSTVKALNLWNGTSNNAPPDGWRELGFNDSGWASAIVGNGAVAALAGADVLWTHSTPQSNGQANLIRQKFTLSAGQPFSVALTLAADDYFIGFWINNVLVYQETTTRFSGSEVPIITLDLDPGILLPGQQNIIAIHATNHFPFAAGAEWKLVMS